MIEDGFLVRAENMAEQLFRKDLLNCAESVFKAIMLASNIDCSMEILRLASAFGRGMGGAGCACGALVGGQMAIGYFFGREKQSGICPNLCAYAAKLLHDRFKEYNKGTCCRILHGGLPYGTPEQFESCCQRAAKTARITASIINEVIQHSQAVKDQTVKTKQ